MDSSKMGLLFKNIRKSKKLSLNDVSGDLMSLSFISKFERGESEISLSRFIILLNNLNFTIEEFYNLYINEYPDEIEDLMTTISISFLNGDILGLKRTRKEEKEKHDLTGKRRYLYNSIMVKAFISELTNLPMDNNDISILTEFLFGIEYWGKYELMLLGNSMPSIHLDSLDLLLKELISSSENVTDTESNYILKIDILLNAVNNALKRKRLDYALDYINYLEKLDFSSVKFMHEKVLLEFFKEMIKFIKDDDEISKNKIDKMFKALKWLSLDRVALSFEIDYEYFLEIYNIWQKKKKNSYQFIIELIINW